MHRLFILMPVLAALGVTSVQCNNNHAAMNNSVDERVHTPVKITTGAEQMELVLQHCQGKKIALVANQTSQVNGVHLLDTLLAQGVKVTKVFGPEHGFRGNAADGELVASETDWATGLPVVSLYGKNRKPTADQLQDVDVLIFDIQDVGARFYTYISTLHLIMEAAAENDLAVLVLDRPNPHGHYIDGPVLEEGFSSFVGMHPVPVVHGMTVGEYARMINGEGWLKNGLTCHLEIIPCTGYSHTTRYELPVAPSPNLPDMTSIYLYPSLAFFEGTEVSVGRGTDRPFQQIGMPGFDAGNHDFTPLSIPGVSKYPPHEGKTCRGFDLSQDDYSSLNQINLEWLLTMYRHAPDQNAFFLKSGFFNKLAGTDQLMKQIRSGLTAEEIRTSWQPGLEQFNTVRQRYLLYDDF